MYFQKQPSKGIRDTAVKFRWPHLVVLFNQFRHIIQTNITIEHLRSFIYFSTTCFGRFIPCHYQVETRTMRETYDM
jgi:hypothetical protein